MVFIERAKIRSTRLYEFFEGGYIDTIATSPDQLVRRTNQVTFSGLRSSTRGFTFGSGSERTPSFSSAAILF
jgi:hypothetical protein